MSRNKLGVSDYRRLSRLQEALMRIKNEITPQQDEDLDQYERHRQMVHDEITMIKNAMKTFKNLTNARDVIEEKMRLRESFIKCNNDITAYGKLLEGLAKKRMKDKQQQMLRVKAGQEWMKVMREELMKLAQKSTEIDLNGTDLNTQDGLREQRRQEHRQKRLERRQKRRRKNGLEDEGADANDFAEGLEMIDTTPATENEQMFLRKVEQAREQEEEMLQLISQGLTELHELAQSLNKLLKQQQMLIDEVDEKMDVVQKKLDSNNKRLDHVLKVTGGMMRFVPFFICALFVLALAAFAYNRIKG